eukprot:GFYU01010166.1.p1 GENE.GFYU01010166.1~~GFYU01010166.1.p1  ORF type:complete len:350 (+),score=64.08 GFYU01010166.1:21-1070(+)
MTMATVMPSHAGSGGDQHEYTAEYFQKLRQQRDARTRKIMQKFDPYLAARIFPNTKEELKDLWSVNDSHALIIQRFYRGFLARKDYGRILLEKYAREEEERDRVEKERLKEGLALIQRENMKVSTEEKKFLSQRRRKLRDRSARRIQKSWSSFKLRKFSLRRLASQEEALAAKSADTTTAGETRKQTQPDTTAKKPATEASASPSASPAKRTTSRDKGKGKARVKPHPPSGPPPSQVNATAPPPVAGGGGYLPPMKDPDSNAVVVQAEEAIPVVPLDSFDLDFMKTKYTNGQLEDMHQDSLRELARSMNRYLDEKNKELIIYMNERDELTLEADLLNVTLNQLLAKMVK